MEYKKIKSGSYNIHMIKTNKFKSTTMEIIFSDEINKEEITKRNFLADMLTYSNAMYQNRHSLVVAMQDLYSLKFFASSYRIGNYYITDFNTIFLNEKYSEKGMLEKSIVFAIDTILNPNIKDKKFDKTSFEIVKHNLENQIESIKENPLKYTIINMLEKMDNKAKYSYHSYGYKEDLEKITREKLYEYYKKFINESNIDIYIIGDIDFDRVEEIIKENLKIKTIKKSKINYFIGHNKINKKLKNYFEKDNTNQSKLSIGCKLKNLTLFERNYVINIYNAILGGNSESKLNKIIREKNSYCYYIGSSANKVDNLLLINSYISKKNYDKVIKLIKQEMKNIALGKITDEEIEKAKRSYIASIDEIFDSQGMIIASYYAMEILDSDEPAKRKEEVLKVTKEDIVNISKKVFMDTIFLLGGESDE